MENLLFLGVPILKHTIVCIGDLCLLIEVVAIILLLKEHEVWDKYTFYFNKSFNKKL